MKIKTIGLAAIAACATIACACSDDNDGPTPTPLPGNGDSQTATQSGLYGYRDGITPIGTDSMAFVLFAPGKQTVHLIGDFNDWQPTDSYQMEKNGDRFFIKIGGLESGKEYVCQYLIDNSIRIADPYSIQISDPDNDAAIDPATYPNLIAYPTGKTTEIASVVSTAPDTYNWTVPDFALGEIQNAVIYEMHLRDFTTEGTVAAATEKIPYLKDLGVNIVELMPINEFEGNDSWGYNPSFYFATDKAYGTRDDYRRFIDECHANGMGVVIDMVLNHSYGQSPMVRMYQTGTAKPSADNPWYYVSHNFAISDAQWGADFNHDSQYTRAFVDSVCAYWMEMYKVDGFRFDFTKGFSNTPYPATGDNAWGSSYDAARISNLKRIYDQLKRRNPDALMICEHLADNMEEAELARYGIYLWGNMNYNFNEATMGWTTNSDLSWAAYTSRGWDAPRLVTYMESHDEERIMFKNIQYGNETADGSYSAKHTATALARTEAAAVVLMSIPGPKMIWQFGELGYDVSIDFNGRTGRKPVRWSYFDDTNRRALYDVFAKMNKLRNENAIFGTADFDLNVAGAMKTVTLRLDGKTAVAVANFDVAQRQATINFGTAGTFADAFGGESIEASAEGTATTTIEPGGYRLYMN